MSHRFRSIGPKAILISKRQAVTASVSQTVYDGVERANGYDGVERCANYDIHKLVIGGVEGREEGWQG